MTITTTTSRFRFLAVFVAVAAMIASLLAVLPSAPAEATHVELVAVNESEFECAAGGGNNTIQVPIEVRDPLTGSNIFAGHEITVKFDTVAASSTGPTATADVDYVRTSGKITIPASAREGTAEITLFCDSDDSASEQEGEEFTVFFYDADGASFDSQSDQRALATILNGAPDPGPQFTITGPATPVTEDDPSTLNPPSVNATFTVCLDDTSDGGGSVRASTRNGTATADDDYNSRQDVLLLWGQDAENCQEFDVSLQHDNAPEPQEHFFVDLSSPDTGNPLTSATLAKGTAAAHINDDDIPSVLIGEAVRSESAANLPVTFSLEGGVDATEDIYVVWHSAEGSASDGVDYTGTGGRVATRIDQNTSSGTHTITLHGDSALEDWHETFYAVVDCIEADSNTDCDNSSTAATKGNTFGRQAIQDDEPKINVSDGSAIEGEKMTFTVTLEQFRPDQDISVKFATKDGTAKAGEDYKSKSGTLTWDQEDRDANNKSKTVTIETLQDGTAEGNHSFTLELSQPSFAGLGDGSGEGLITDDDAFNVDAGPAKSGESATQVSFTGSASGGSGSYTFTWDFGDGTATQTGVTVKHRFDDTGTYTVTLTVKDNGTGSTSKDTTTATITDSGKVNRSSGLERISTAIDVSSDHWSRAGTVLLATAYNYPDALAAGPLSQKLDAPLLLTGTDNEVPDNVKAELDRLNAEKVIILGGAQAVPQGQADDLARSGYQVQRIADVSRFGTAADIATTVGPSANNEVTVALGAHSDPNQTIWADSLSAGSFASLPDPLPALLTHSDFVPEQTLDALEQLNTKKVFLLGGTRAISPTVQAQLEAEGYTVQRVAGQNRFETSVEAGKIAMDRYPAGQVHPVFATGSNYPDGLTSGALAGKVTGPVVLVTPDDLDNIPGTRQFLRDNANRFDVGTVVGGEKVVSENVRTQARSDIDKF